MLEVGQLLVFVAEDATVKVLKVIPASLETVIVKAAVVIMADLKVFQQGLAKVIPASLETVIVKAAVVITDLKVFQQGLAKVTTHLQK